MYFWTFSFWLQRNKDEDSKKKLNKEGCKGEHKAFDKWDKMWKQEKENPCFVCGHYHKFEIGKVCVICGQQLQEVIEQGS